MLDDCRLIEEKVIAEDDIQPIIEYEGTRGKLITSSQKLCVFIYFHSSSTFLCQKTLFELYSFFYLFQQTLSHLILIFAYKQRKSQICCIPQMG